MSLSDLRILTKTVLVQRYRIYDFSHGVARFSPSCLSSRWTGTESSIARVRSMPFPGIGRQWIKNDHHSNQLRNSLSKSGDWSHRIRSTSRSFDFRSLWKQIVNDLKMILDFEWQAGLWTRSPGLHYSTFELLRISIPYIIRRFRSYSGRFRKASRHPGRLS